MKYRLVITGSGGFIGSYLVPELIKDGFDVITVRYKDGELVFSGLLEENETVIVINMAAATKDAHNFTIGYQMSVVMINKLFEKFKQQNVNVEKFIQFASFGELLYEQKFLETIFYKKYKESGDTNDNYQFWKIKQRQTILSNCPDCTINVVIPFVTDNDSYYVIEDFNNMRWRRKILITRLMDIYTAVKNVISNRESRTMIIPKYKRIRIKGGGTFLKTFFARFLSSVIAFDKNIRSGLFYTISSQSIKID